MEKLETLRSFNWWLDKESMMHPHSGMLISSKKEQAIDRQQSGWILHAYCWVTEARLRRLHAESFPSQDILDKSQNCRDSEATPQTDRICICILPRSPGDLCRFKLRKYWCKGPTGNQPSQATGCPWASTRGIGPKEEQPKNELTYPETGQEMCLQGNTSQSKHSSWFPG